MKKICKVLLFFVSFTGVFAQDAFSGSHDMKLQVGYAAYGRGTGIIGTFDYGVFDYVSVGGGAEIYNSDYKGGNLFIFGRANLHLNNLVSLPESLDVYPGLDLGIINNFFDWGAHIGVRYFFTEQIGVYTELGNKGSLGISINF